MKKLTAKWKSLTTSLRSFLILALVFLAVGLGTLGSVVPLGNAYGLWTKSEGDDLEPAIVFSLSNLTVKQADGTSSTVSLNLKRVYVNVAAVYAKPGEAATLQLGRAYSASSSYYSYVEGRIENYDYTSSDDVKTTKDCMSNWVEPFTIPEAGWKLSDGYRYYRLKATTHNVLINEIVFVGEKLDGDGNGTGSYCVIPATIYTGDATKLPIEREEGESLDHARERALKQAGALLDAQTVPVSASSYYFRYSQQEAHTLATIREMQAGNSYDVRNIGKYQGDLVYGALGTDILYLGTLIFGVSPFGLRFFPMLASFGVLVVGFLLIRRLTGSDRGGFVFALLYALSTLAFGLGHLGTPLMLGVFFFVLALDLMLRYCKDGMKRADFASAAPVAFSGLFAAVSILVNGVYLIPCVGLVALFVYGAMKHRALGRAALEAAIEDAEMENEAPMSEGNRSESSSESKAPSQKAKYAARLAHANRYKERVAPMLFAVFALIGLLFVSVLALYPVMGAYSKLYDDPSNPAHSFLGLMFETFKGGFVGNNYAVGSTFAWSAFYTLFRGTGDPYAVMGISLDVIGLLAAAIGVVFAVCRIVAVARADRGHGRGEALALPIILLAGAGMSFACSFFGVGGIGFRAVAAVFGWALFALFYEELCCTEDAKRAKTVKTLTAVGIALLGLTFVISVFFTFSIPLPAAFMNVFFG